MKNTIVFIHPNQTCKKGQRDKGTEAQRASSLQESSKAPIYGNMKTWESANQVSVYHFQKKSFILKLQRVNYV